MSILIPKTIKKTKEEKMVFRVALDITPKNKYLIG